MERPPVTDNDRTLSTSDEEPSRDGLREIAATSRPCTRTRLLVAATTAWGIFLVLHVLLTGRWWPWLIVEATPPLTAVAVPLLLLVLTLLLRPVRRRLTTVLVLLLLLGVHLAGYGPGWTGTGGQGTSVKVFAWSTDYWQMSDDKEAFYAFLRRQDADVYLLQEYLYRKEGVEPPHQVIRIDDSARLRAEFPGYQISVDGELLTLSRLPVVATHHQRVPSTGTDWFWKGTKAQRTDIRVGGRTVSFYNVHLPVPFRIGDDPFSGRFYRLFKEQSTWRLRELRRLRTDLAGNPHPALLAGDFNSPWMELSSLGSGTRAHGFRNSLAAPRTWPVSDYRLPRLWRLDWVYTTGDLAVPTYHLAGGESFSDHAAQKFRLVVPNEAPRRSRVQKGGVR
ncbi:endonuclease/exonuclease/phosphatase family protein [Actinomadura sp. 7K534]|uniref:endonuclease/exonuclease/phosphatase family protein n=1 Tax=Actinomadura sp. 7K534 TaxID=2530366 RepID=UPI00104CB391|nr:endonuclease/exonuclease/phosphatase family protein [Actinomadura sp. 7K534]TDB94049.1 endonuclease [Actinomadura sp. 7K534]